MQSKWWLVFDCCQCQWHSTWFFGHLSPRMLQTIRIVSNFGVRKCRQYDHRLCCPLLMCEAGRCYREGSSGALIFRLRLLVYELERPEEGNCFGAYGFPTCKPARAQKRRSTFCFGSIRTVNTPIRRRYIYPISIRSRITAGSAKHKQGNAYQYGIVHSTFLVAYSIH